MFEQVNKKLKRQISKAVSIVLCAAMLVTALPAELLGGVTNVEAAETTTTTKTRVLDIGSLIGTGEGQIVKGTKDTTARTIGDFTVLASTTNETQYNQNNQTVEGLSLQGYVNFKGAASTADKSIKFTTTGAATVTVYARGSNKSETRTLRFIEEKASDSPIDGTPDAVPNGNGAPEKVTETLDAAGTYYLGSTSGGIHIYRVEITEKFTSQSPVNVGDLGTTDGLEPDYVGDVTWTFPEKDEDRNVKYEGIEGTYRGLKINAKSGKFAFEADIEKKHVNLTSGAIIQVPVSGNCKITVTASDAGAQYALYTINGEEASTDKAETPVTYIGEAGYVDIESTGNAYIKSIKVEHIGEVVPTEVNAKVTINNKNLLGENDTITLVNTDPNESDDKYDITSKNEVKLKVNSTYEIVSSNDKIKAVFKDEKPTITTTTEDLEVIVELTAIITEVEATVKVETNGLLKGNNTIKLVNDEDPTEEYTIASSSDGEDVTVKVMLTAGVIYKIVSTDPKIYAETDKGDDFVKTEESPLNVTVVLTAMPTKVKAKVTTENRELLEEGATVTLVNANDTTDGFDITEADGKDVELEPGSTYNIVCSDDNILATVDGETTVKTGAKDLGDVLVKLTDKVTVPVSVSGVQNGYTLLFVNQDGSDDKPAIIDGKVTLKIGATYTLKCDNTTIDATIDGKVSLEVKKDLKKIVINVESNEPDDDLDKPGQVGDKTWTFKVENGDAVLIQGEKGKYAGLEIDATTGKLNVRNDSQWAQFNTGTIIKVPVDGNCIITVNGYNDLNFTINGEEEAKIGAQKYLYMGAAGYVDVVSNNNSYIGSITVKHVSVAETEIKANVIVNDPNELLQEGDTIKLVNKTKEIDITSSDGEDGKEVTLNIYSSYKIDCSNKDIKATTSDGKKTVETTDTDLTVTIDLASAVTTTKPVSVTVTEEDLPEGTTYTLTLVNKDADAEEASHVITDGGSVDLTIGATYKLECTNDDLTATIENKTELVVGEDLESIEVKVVVTPDDNTPDEDNFYNGFKTKNAVQGRSYVFDFTKKENLGSDPYESNGKTLKDDLSKGLFTYKKASSTSYYHSTTYGVEFQNTSTLTFDVAGNCYIVVGGDKNSNADLTASTTTSGGSVSPEVLNSHTTGQAKLADCKTKGDNTLVYEYAGPEGQVTLTVGNAKAYIAYVCVIPIGESESIAAGEYDFSITTGTEEYAKAIPGLAFVGNFADWDNKHGFKASDASSTLVLNLAEEATIIVTACCYGQGNVKSNKGKVTAVDITEEGLDSKQYIIKGASGETRLTLGEGAYIKRMEVRYAVELDSSIIEVWDFGAMTVAGSNVRNILTVDTINGLYPKGTEAGATNVNILSFTAKDTNDLGAVKFVTDKTNNRLRTTNKSITRFDEKEKKDKDGNVYDGFLYSNNSATRDTRMEFYLYADDTLTCMLGSNGGAATYLLLDPENKEYAEFDYTAEDGYVEEAVFHAGAEGWYKLVCIDEKLVCARATRQHAPDVAVSGTIDTTEATAIPAGYGVLYTNMTTGNVTEMAREGGAYTGTLKGGYTYKASLKNANGFVVRDGRILNVAANQQAVTNNLTIETVDQKKITGTVTGLDAADLAKVKFVFTIPEEYVFEPQLTLNRTTGAYTLMVENGVEYDITALDVNDYTLQTTKIVATEDTDDVTIAFEKKTTYDVTLKITGVQDTTNAKVTFTSVDEKYTDGKTPYTYQFDDLDSIKLRDGRYSVKVTGVGKEAVIQGVTPNVNVKGAAVTDAPVPFSKLTTWDFAVLNDVTDIETFDEKSYYAGLQLDGAISENKIYLLGNADSKVTVPGLKEGDRVTITYCYTAAFTLTEDGSTDGDDKVYGTGSGSTGTIESVVHTMTADSDLVISNTDGTFEGQKNENVNQTYLCSIAVLAKAEQVPYAATIKVGKGEDKYKTINDALAAVRKMDRTDDQKVTIMIDPGDYEEMLVLDTPNVTLKNAAAKPSIELKNKGVDIDDNAVRVTWYYGHGYTYYSMGTDCKYNAELLAANKSNGYASFKNPGSGTTNGSYWNATVVITADKVSAEGIIFENSFNQYISKKSKEDVIEAQGSAAKEGAVKRTDMAVGDTAVQDRAYVERAAALAIYNEKKEIYFENCKFIGRQDTLYGGTGATAAFYDCSVYGAVDYIFGPMTAVFAKCDLVFNTSEVSSDLGYITAAQTPDGYRGLLMWNCTVTSTVPGVDTASEYRSKAGYFGRPWAADTGEAVFYETIVEATDSVYFKENPSLIVKGGWFDSLAGQSAKSMEYNTHEWAMDVNTGAELDNSANREKWATQLTDEQAKAITVEAFLGDWAKEVFTADMLKIVVPKGMGTINNMPVDELKDPVNGTKFELPITLSGLSKDKKYLGGFSVMDDFGAYGTKGFDDDKKLITPELGAADPKTVKGVEYPVWVAGLNNPTVDGGTPNDNRGWIPDKGAVLVLEALADGVVTFICNQYDAKKPAEEQKKMIFIDVTENKLILEGEPWKDKLYKFEVKKGHKYYFYAVSSKLNLCGAYVVYEGDVVDPDDPGTDPGKDPSGTNDGGDKPGTNDGGDKPGTNDGDDWGTGDGSDSSFDGWDRVARPVINRVEYFGGSSDGQDKKVTVTVTANVGDQGGQKLVVTWKNVNATTTQSKTSTTKQKTHKFDFSCEGPGKYVVTATLKRKGLPDKKTTNYVTIKANGRVEFTPEREGVHVELLDDGEYTYTGSAIKPAIAVYNGDELLTEGVDYTVKYTNNVKAGNKNDGKKAPTIIVTGKGKLTGKTTQTFTIQPKNLEEDTYDPENGVVVGGMKDGNLIVAENTKISPILVYKGMVLKAGAKKDFVLSTGLTKDKATKNDTNKEITITGVNNYTGKLTLTLDVRDKSQLQKITAVQLVKGTKYEYNGEKHTVKISAVKAKKATLTELDYVIVYNGNQTSAGAQKFTVVGMGLYTGSKTTSFKITPRKTTLTHEVDDSLKVNGTVTLSYKSTGVTFNDAITVTDPGLDKTLVLGKDYKVSYSNNKKAGTGKYSITFLGNYKGSAALKNNTFTIAKLNLADLTHTDYPDERYGELYIKSADKAYGKKAAIIKSAPYVLVDGVALKTSDYTVKYYLSNGSEMKGANKVSLNAGETTTITVEITGKNNCTGSTTTTYDVINTDQKDISKVKVIPQTSAGKKQASVSYSGSAVYPDQIVIMEGKTPIATLTPDNWDSNPDFEVTFVNNIEKGKATIIVTGTGSNRGSKTATYKVGSRNLAKDEKAEDFWKDFKDLKAILFKSAQLFAQ